MKTFFYGLALFALALFIRVEYFSHTEVINPFSGDASAYMKYAENLDRHHIFSRDTQSASPAPDAYWAPGYPFFIVLSTRVAKFMGSNPYSTLMLTQALLGALVVLLTYLIAKLFLSHKLALSAALLSAFSPHLISMGNYILTESLFSFTLLLSLYLFMLLLERQKLGLAIGTGLSFGAAYMVNPVMFFSPLLLALWFSWRTPVLSKKVLVSMLLSFLVIVSAWSLRNFINVDANQSGSSDRVLANLIVGSHSDFYDIWRANPRDPNNPATLDAAEVQGSIPAFLNILGPRIQAEPAEFAHWYLLAKPYLLWSWDILIGQGDIHVFNVKYSLYQQSALASLSYSVMKSTHVIVFAFALFGMFFWLKNHHPQASVLYIALIYISAVYVVLQAEPRYSVPLRPEMYLAALFFLSEMLKVYKSKQGA